MKLEVIIFYFFIFLFLYFYIFIFLYFYIFIFLYFYIFIFLLPIYYFVTDLWVKIRVRLGCMVYYYLFV